MLGNGKLSFKMNQSWHGIYKLFGYWTFIIETNFSVSFQFTLHKIYENKSMHQMFIRGQQFSRQNELLVLNL